MTAITPPATHSQLVTDLGYAYVFAEQEIRRELADMLNVLQLGVVPLVGDAAGTGSDTIRVTRLGGVGWAEAMATLGSETAPITPTGFTTGFDVVSIARHGLAKEESYTAQILGREPAAMLEGLKALIPESWLKTFRQKVATAGASFADTVGTTGTVWTFDDELDLVAYFNETEGFEGNAVTMRHPEQMTQLRESIRNEPNFQFPEITSALQSLRPGGTFVDFLGFRNFATHDVTNAGGDHQGFAFAPGAIGWAVASTLGVKVEDPEQALVIPEFGLVCEWKSTGNEATAQWDANAYFGVATADPSVAPQARIISLNT
jgi:hypothetical protein